MTSVDPSGMATWITVYSRWGCLRRFYYNHAYIHFDFIQCDPSCNTGARKVDNKGGSSADTGRNWGFYPPNNWCMRGTGSIEHDDHYGDDYKAGCKMYDHSVEKHNPSIEFEHALCDCMKDSFRKKDKYEFPTYTCGTWARDMWNCAERKTTR